MKLKSTQKIIGFIVADWNSGEGEVVMDPSFMRDDEPLLVADVLKDIAHICNQNYEKSLKRMRKKS